MTDIDLDAIEARANAATEGPWLRREGHAEIDGQNYAEVLIPGRVECGSYCYGGRSTIEGDRLDADLAFIAAARTDLPAVVAALRDALAEVEQWKAAFIKANDAVHARESWIDGAKVDLDALDAEVERLREEAEVDAGLIRSIIAAREHVERTLTAERDDARAAIARVRALDPADHATSSRDYGRGYAQALRDSLRALDGDA